MVRQTVLPPHLSDLKVGARVGTVQKLDDQSDLIRKMCGMCYPGISTVLQEFHKNMSWHVRSSVDLRWPRDSRMAVASHLPYIIATSSATDGL